MGKKPLGGWQISALGDFPSPISPMELPKPLVLVMAFEVVGETSSAQNATVVDTENIAQAAIGGKSWAAASVNQSLAVGNRVRTRQRSRATIKLSEL